MNKIVQAILTGLVVMGITVSLKAAPVTLTTGSVSGTSNGINYVFTRLTDVDVSTLVDYGVLTFSIGELTMGLVGVGPAFTVVDVPLTRNGTVETMHFELIIDTFDNAKVQPHIQASPIDFVVFNTPASYGSVNVAYNVWFQDHDVPEPTTWAMFALGLGLVGFRAVQQNRRLQNLS